MIRNVVIHPQNDQPLLADLFAMPTATDVGLPCTNLRTLAGERPLFADHSGSFFLFPLIHIRFVEVPPGVAGEPDEIGRAAPAAEPVLAPAGEEELTIDEDFLRRVREA